MRMWALGSTECQSKKEMQQPSQELSERTPLQGTPSQTPRHSLPPLSLWNIVYHNHLIPFNRSFFESVQPSGSQSSHYSQNIIRVPPLSQDKQKEIRSMLNYLGPTSNRLPKTSSQTPHALFRCFLSSLTPSHPIAIKVNEFFPQGLPVFDLSQQSVCRKKQTLCFSNKWRQTQQTIYVLMHPLPITNKQQQSIRAHFLNQRGLLLQTAINLEPASYISQILNIIKKHYRKVKQILIIRQSNEIDIDLVLQVRENVQECTVGAISIRERKDFVGFGEKSQGELFQAEGAIGVFGYLFEKQDVAMVTTRPCKEDVKHHLSLVSGILERESQVACELLKQDYFSSFFNQKQILLRLFAFYFNFLTLEPMLLLNKDDLLDRITTAELFSHKQALTNLFRQETATSHTSSAHGCSLYCQVCKKRTKIICEKCCMNLNRFFGLCQKNCFQMYHQHIDQYNEQPKTNKKIADSDQGFSSQLESGLSELSSRGRKRVKKIQRLMEDDEESLDLEEKWGEVLQTENQDYNNLVRYSMVGLVPQSVVKKIDHLKMRLDQLAFLNLTGHTQPKQEEDCDT